MVPFGCCFFFFFFYFARDRSTGRRLPSWSRVVLQSLFRSSTVSGVEAHVHAHTPAMFVKLQELRFEPQLAMWNPAIFTTRP